MTRALWFLAIGAALIGGPMQAAADPVVIGASLPITGGFAVNGQKHKDGYELCVDLINKSGGLLGEPVEIIISDNQSNNETAQAQFERLINENKVSVFPIVLQPSLAAKGSTKSQAKHLGKPSVGGHDHGPG